MRTKNDEVAECRSKETPRIVEATRRRILACECHIKVNCGENSLNFPRKFVSFGHLQAKIHAIEL